MADANLKIPSEERIRFNASESIINAVSPRVDISTITGGHRMVVTDIDGVETADIMDGVKGDTGDAAGFGTVSASVDANVGTPSVTVTSSGPNTAKNFDISFKNLKGNTGDAAGFGTVSASVDANVGTPSVTVTSSGPNTAKNFDISFKNLKGVKGDTGAAAGFDTPTASVDGYIGTPSVAVTATGPATAKKFDFAFHNLKGEKGDTGSIESLIVDGTEPEEGAGVSVDGPISELSAEGWAEQFSTTGKNLFDEESIINVNRRGVLSPITRNTDGTITVNQSIGVNGYYALDQLIAFSEIALAVSFDIMLAGSHSSSDVVICMLDDSATSSITNIITKTVIKNTWQHVEAILTVSGDKSSGYLLVEASNTGNKATLRNIQLELGSTATEYEPYTGGAPSPSPDYPQEIEVAKGRNLIDIADKASITNNGITWAYSNGRLTASGTSTGNGDIYLPLATPTEIKAGEQYTVSLSGVDVRSVSSPTYLYSGSWIQVGAVNNSTHMLTFTADSTYTIIAFQLRIANGQTANIDASIQLTLGSTPQPYVPYGYVGMEVRDANDQLLSTTPIPLPERGWVGSLPDGTADVLHLDGAGKVEWEKKTNEVTVDGSENWQTGESGTTNNRYNITDTTLGIPIRRRNGGNFINYCDHFIAESQNIRNQPWGIFGFRNDGWLIFFDTNNVHTLESFKTWLSTHPVTVLYPLNTPVTESLGYIDLPDIPAGSTVTIPELDALGISYYVDNGAIRKLAEQYKARLEATSFSGMEDAITELAAEVQKNTNRTQLYFGYDTVNGKQMISVFKRNV